MAQKPHSLEHTVLDEKLKLVFHYTCNPPEIDILNKRKLPSLVAVAPSRINTAENPKIKNNAFNKMTRFFLFRRKVFSSVSFIS